MLPETTTAIIACVPYDPTLPGVALRSCANCGAPVSVHAATLSSYPPGAVPVCNTCAHRLVPLGQKALVAPGTLERLCKEFPNVEPARVQQLLDEVTSMPFAEYDVER